MTPTEGKDSQLIRLPLSTFVEVWLAMCGTGYELLDRLGRITVGVAVLILIYVGHSTGTGTCTGECTGEDTFFTHSCTVCRELPLTPA